jgi:dephospho-CoA kinase
VPNARLRALNLGIDSQGCIFMVCGRCSDSPSSSQNKPGKIALTGGIATGKSTVAKFLAELGALILDADQVAREVVKPGTDCWQKLRNLLGPAYFDEDGSLKRRKLRERIIHDNPCRSAVNAILHPCIVQEMDQQWRSAHRLRPEKIVIFDIPLLFEADLAHHFDTIILVYAPREIQIQRLRLRDGLTYAEAAETLTMQLPIEAKRANSHLVIDNSDDLDHTLGQVRSVWEKLIHHGSLKTSI